jgi:hypothetical protein
MRSRRDSDAAAYTEWTLTSMTDRRFQLICSTACERIIRETMSSKMFLYLRDPLFLTAVTAYLSNRLLLEPFLRVTFFHSYVNDLISIPVLVPLMLFAARRLGLRSHDLPPLANEIIVPVIVWSILFEIVLPQSMFWRRWITGDPYDVLCYALGAMVASMWWQRFYSRLTHPNDIRP